MTFAGLSTRPLQEILTALNERFNSPLRLEAEEWKLESFRRDESKTITEGLMEFLDLVNTFNLRCQTANLRFRRKQWSMNRTLDYMTKELISEVDFRIEFYKLWNGRAENDDMESIYRVRNGKTSAGIGCGYSQWEFTTLLDLWKASEAMGRLVCDCGGELQRQMFNL